MSRRQRKDSTWGGNGEDWRNRNQLRRELSIAWASLFGGVNWRWFVTLTFDPKRVYPVSEERASREAFRWCCDTASMLRRPLGWLYATERGQGGQWHAHVLIVGCCEPLDVPVAVWRLKNGEADIREVWGAIGATEYLSKDAAIRGEVTWSDTLYRYIGRNARFEQRRLNSDSGCAATPNLPSEM